MAYVEPETKELGDIITQDDWNLFVENFKALKAQLDTLAPFPVGTVLALTTPTGDNAPAGWLICGGQAVSRTTYAPLFAAIGTLYGAGDGSTTFNVPDLRGRVVVGRDTMGGAAANRVPAATGVAATGGSATHVLTAEELPAHTHAVRTEQNGNTNIASGNYLAAGISIYQSVPIGGTEFLNINTIVPTGEFAPHNNLQPYMTVQFIIRAL